MRKVFQRMLNVQVRGMTKDDEETEEKMKKGSVVNKKGRVGGGEEEADLYGPDTLQQELRRRKREADR